MLNGTTALTNIEHGHNTTVTSESGRMRLTDNLLSINPQRLWVSWKTMPVLTRTFFSLRLSLSNHETINNKLSAWRDNGRQGSVILPTGSGKTFLAVQAIADAGVSTLVVVPTIDLMNQWHSTLTNAFGNQLPDGVGVLGGVVTM